MKTICITGLDGSGKSTQANLLHKKIPKSKIISVWNILKDQEYQAWSIYKTPPDVEKYVMNLYPISRSLFIFHCLIEAYNRALNSDLEYIIFDGYWYKYWAIEKAMGSTQNFENFLKHLERIVAFVQLLFQ